MGVKHYAYYIKGNKFALVEKDTSFDNDVTSKEYGPGSDRAQWKSPKVDVDEGLQIEYTYAPTYRINSTYTYDSDVFKFIGWGSDGTNLLLFTYGHNDQTHKALNSAFSADDWVYIQSGRWAGLHQVKSTGSTDGILTLKTLCHITPSILTCDVDFDTDETLVGNDGDAILKLSQFKDDTANLSTKYLYITDAATTARNDGFFTVTHGDEATGEINLTAKHYVNSDRDYTSATPVITAGLDDTVTMYNVFYETTDVLKNITVIEDETFELDLPDYLSRALIHYVKAQFLEDLGQIELSEYFMTKFRKKVEEYMSTRHAGPKQASGFWHMR